MKRFITNLKKRAMYVGLAFVMGVSTLSGIVPFVLSQNANAAPVVFFNQGFEASTDGWTTAGGYGSIVRSNSIPSASGSWHALVSSEGYGTGPFSRLGGYGNVWTGQWEANIAVYLDPAWVNGTGFDYSVSATGADGLHRRDFIFHVSKDISTNSLIVAGSNNTNYTVRQDLESLNHHVITTAGWYTLQHVFRNNAGVLAVDLNVRDIEGNLLFTETRSDASDMIPSKIGGNRYAWFTVATVAGGLAIDDVNRIAEPAPVTNINTGETFATIKAAVQDSDTVNGNTIEVYGTLNVTDNTNVNKDLTIRGVAGSVINVSGGNQVLTITSNGVTIEDLTFVKTDKATNDLIGIQANDVTVQDNTFTGQYEAGDGDVTRAMVVSPGRTNAVITGNTVSNLRQPAYLDPLSTGTISNNYVSGTRGWVVSKDSNFVFTGNTWGTNSPVDIAIIVGYDPVDPTPNLNNYTCKLPTMKAQNNNAIIQDQAPASLTTCPNTPPVVNFNTPTPSDNAFVSGTVSGNVTATDDWGMGSYYVRFWKDAFEVAGGGTLLHGCQSAPGAFNLGKTITASCSYDVSSLPDGTKIVLSAQFLDGHTVWGMSKRTFTVDNTDPATPVLQTPANGAAINYNSFWFEWDNVLGATSYEVQFSQSSSTDSNGALNVGVWAGDASHNQPTEPRAWSAGATGTWYWQVRAVDAAGNKSAWTAPWSLTIDMDAPVAPTNLAWTTSTSTPVIHEGVTNEVSGVASWGASSSTDVHHYIYKYWNDIVGNQYKEASPWTNSPVSGTSLAGSFTEGEGVHYFSVAAVDNAGNISAFSTPFKITYDKTAPTVTINEIDSTTDTTPLITGTVTGSDVNKVEVSINGGVWQLATLSAGTWSYQVTTPLTFGTVTVQARATDNANNTTNPEANEAFTVNEVQETNNTTTNQTTTTQQGTGLPLTPFVQDNNDTEVLGEQDTNTEQQVALENDDETDNSAVAGTSDENKDSGDWTAPFGLAWYWWLLILAAVIGGLWWFFAARSRADQE